MAEIKNYPDLPRSSFPEKEDTFPLMSDVDASKLTLVHQYEEYARAGNIQACNQLLTSYPELESCLFNAQKLNKLRDAVIATQRYYLEDVHDMVELTAQNAVGINDAPSEEQSAITAYSSKKVDALLDDVTRVITISLPASGWSNAAPYTQTITSDAILASQNPVVSLHIPDNPTAANVKAWNKAFGMVDEGITEDGRITFKCYNKKPAVDFSVSMKGV